jgi:photosystem II stability/assembly factor-like uncharacterized protein
MVSTGTLIRPNKYAGILLVFLVLQSYAQIRPTTGEERLKALQKRQEDRIASPLKEISFRNVGPAIMGGRVVDMEVNPEDPTEFYLAYATGGLWHTKNNGLSFTPLFDQEMVIGIGDIAINWNSPNRTIWLGTGEVNSSRSTYAGIGMYKSSDNGANWTYLGLADSHHIGEVVVHPTDSLTAWVAVMGHLYSPNKERGIYKTTDGGKSWKQTLYIDETTGAIDLQINPQQPTELYAAMWYRTRSAWNFEESGKTSGIYKSADGGSTWQLISKEGSGFVTGVGTGRIGLAVYPKQPNIVYAVVDNQDAREPAAKKENDSTYQLSDLKSLSKDAFQQLDSSRLKKFLATNRVPSVYTVERLKRMVAMDSIAPEALYNFLFVDDGFQNKSVKGCEVYRSDDAGKTWQKTNQKPIDNYSSYGYYFGKIYVSPSNPDRVFILGIDLMQSKDGGKTFVSIDKPNVHSDHHALWINPRRDEHIINGNDGGCNISYDRGDVWFKVQAPSVGQYYAIAVDKAKPYNIYGGLQDNGSWYGPSTHKENPYWMERGEYAYKRIGGGDGMQAQVDTRTNQTVYTGSQFGFYTRINLATRERKMIRPQHTMGEFPLRFNWQTPILLSTHNQDILYYGSSKFHRSLKQGEELQTLSGDLTNGRKTGDVPFGTITTISESPLRFGLLYIGTDDGLVHVSRDGGNSWTKIGQPAKKQSGLPQGLYVSRVVASKWKEGRVYVTLNGYRNDLFTAYIYVSEDYGQSWKQLGMNLPAEPVNVLREDPKMEGILYAGTDGGLYASMDKGNSFHAFTKDLPAAIPVHDLAIQEEANELVVGTHGRSIYICSLSGIQKLVSEDPKK